MEAQDQAEPQTSLAHFIRIDRLRYDVEKQILELSPSERERVIQVLSQPIPRTRLTSVKRLKEYGVFEIDVTRSVRMYYRKKDGKNGIIFVGRHGHADHFMDHYCGNLPERWVSLGESEIMSKKRARNFHANGQASPLGDKPTSAEAPPSAPAVLDWAAPLQQMIFERVEQAAADKIEHLQEDLKAEKTLLNQLLHESESRFKNQLHANANQCKAHQDKVHGDLSSIRDSLEGMEQTLRTDLEKLNQRADHTVAHLGERIEQMATTLIRERIDPLAQRLEEMAAEQVRFVGRTEEQQADRAQEVARIAQTLHRLEDSVEELRMQMRSERTARLVLEESVNDVRADLEAWREEQARKASETFLARLVRFFGRKR